VIVAYHQAHAVEATANQRADEHRPGRSLVVAGRELDPKNATLTGHRHSGCDQSRHGHDPAGFTDLEIGRIEEDIGIGGVVERTLPEGLNLGVECRADAADLAAADAGDPEALNQIVDPAG
jgi:hypothetical protein